MSFLSQNRVFKRNWNWLRPASAPVPPPVTEPIISTAGTLPDAWFVSYDSGATWAPFYPGVESNGVIKRNGSEWRFLGDLGFPYFARSVDSFLWTTQLFPGGALPIAFGSSVNTDLAFELGLAYRSVSAAAFTTHVTGVGGGPSSAIRDGSTWFLITDAGIGFPNWATSVDDGVTWTPQPNVFYTGMGAGLIGLVTIFRCGANLVVTGNAYNMTGSRGVWISTDNGSTWNTPAFSGEIVQPNRDSATDGVSRFVVIGLGDRYAYSLDSGANVVGAFIPGSPFVECIDVIYQNGLFIVFKQNGEVYTSPDCVNWTLIGDASLAGYVWGGFNQAPQLA